MGKVYGHAHVVFDDAGAKDSTEGLFIAERPEPTIIKCPYSPGGVAKGSFNMSVLPKHNLRDSPLRERA